LQGEDVCAAAIREVKEETGVSKNFFFCKKKTYLNEMQFNHI